jgi:putative membrane protein
MLQDALYSWLHFLAIFMMVFVLTAQAILLRADLFAANVKRLIVYGYLYLLTLAMAMATGALRVFLGVKGPAFYFADAWFWVKMALMAVIALCAIAPTRQAMRWRRRRRREPDYLPGPGEAARARRPVMLAAHLLTFVPLCAVLMARGL